MVVLAHTPATGPQAGLQAADLRTVTNPEKRQGHGDEVLLCAWLLHPRQGLPPSVLSVRAKSDGIPIPGAGGGGARRALGTAAGRRSWLEIQ